MLTRRTALALLGSLSAAFTVPQAQGRAPLSGQPGPGYYRYKIGDIEITVVNDGVSRMPIAEGFVSNASVSDVKGALSALFMDTSFYAGPYNPIFVNTGSKLVLIDTGTGEAAFRSSNGLNGRMLSSLASADINPAQVDAVIISHYHGDHINGLLRADGTLAFPNAEVLVPAREHQFWLDDGEMSRATKPRVQEGFKNVRRVFSGEIMKRLRTYEWDADVVPGIRAVATPGHTPGHTSHIVSSEGKQIFVQGDVTHAPFLFARHPDWHFMLDVDPIAAEATRRRVYDMLVADRVLVQGFHYPFPALGHVERDGGGYREVLVPWNSAI
jgi:glyoxylase-like metal-dependent hydrolase (beta-lactamase superfamily II)